MAVCVKSHISFLLLLMTEMWEFSSTGELLHFHNNFWNFKISAILGKGKKLSFSFFSFFNWKSNFLSVLSSWEIHLTSWKSPVENLVRSRVPLIDLDFKEWSEMNWKCPEHCHKSGTFLVLSSRAACWLSWKDDQSSVSDRESTCLYFQILHFTCKYSP